MDELALDLGCCDVLGGLPQRGGGAEGAEVFVVENGVVIVWGFVDGGDSKSGCPVWQLNLRRWIWWKGARERSFPVDALFDFTSACCFTSFDLGPRGSEERKSQAAEYCVLVGESAEQSRHL